MNTPNDQQDLQAHLNAEAHQGKDLFNALVPVWAWMRARAE